MADETTDTPEHFDIDAFFRNRTVGGMRGPGQDEAGDRGLKPPASEGSPLKGTVDDAAVDEAPGGDESRLDTPEAGAESGETPEEKQRRFKSWDEAEEGYRNAQSDLTRRQQEAARARKEAEDARAEAERVRKEAEEYRAKVAAFEREQAEAKMYQELDSFAADRFKTAQQEVSGLDMDAADYAERSAGIMARAETDVRRKARELEKELGTLAAETPSVEPAPEKRDTPATEAPADAAREGERPGEAEKTPPPDVGGADVDMDAARKTFDERMEAEGLDPDDPLFIGVAMKAPSVGEDGRPLGYEDRLEWAITETKRRRSADAAKARQSANAPLARSGQGRPESSGAASPPEPISIDEALKRAREKRRHRAA